MKLKMMLSAKVTLPVKINVKGQDVLIRKTTAIWLFQETERISAD